MLTQTAWLRLLVVSTVIGIATAAACSDRSGKAGLLGVAGAESDSGSRDSVPGDSVPRDSTPRDSIPRDSIPRDSIPRDSIPRDSIPRDSIPRDSIPRDSIPRDSIPRDTIPRDSIPRDSVPRDSVPRDSVPRDTTPGRVASITVTAKSQQVAVGDSGALAATLRDSAGNFVQDPANIVWDLSDSTVLRITRGGTGNSFVEFSALRSGYARFRARYGTLSDTGVVLVSDSAPRDTVGPAASITISPDRINAAPGDSGFVLATVRDSAGREVLDARTAIQWEVSDTSVVRLTGSPEFTYQRIWWALRAGRATLTARYGTLTDTGLVVVVDSIPPDTTPPDTVPGAPASITVFPDSIAAAAGDSGLVYARLRDAAGREVQVTPGAIAWYVSDPTVVRVTNPEPREWRQTRIWWALRSGRATITARYRTLTGEAGVVVRGP